MRSIAIRRAWRNGSAPPAPPSWCGSLPSCCSASAFKCCGTVWPSSWGRCRSAAAPQAEPLRAGSSTAVKSIDAADRAHDLRASGMMGRFLLVGIGVWLHAADSLVTATIAPAIALDLDGIAYINWTVSLYQVGTIIAGAAAAALCARWGIKRVFIGATLIYAGGCVLGAAAPTMGILVLGRLIQGMGGGMLLSLSYVAIEAWFAPELWGRLFALEATIWGAGALLGPLIGAACY